MQRQARGGALLVAVRLGGREASCAGRVRFEDELPLAATGDKNEGSTLVEGSIFLILVVIGVVVGTEDGLKQTLEGVPAVAMPPLTAEGVDLLDQRKRDLETDPPPVLAGGVCESGFSHCGSQATGT
jgi:hypothetical protein